MPLSPAGKFALPMQYCANNLAASATFRALVGAVDAAAAAKRIHFVGVNPPIIWSASTALVIPTWLYTASRPALTFELTAAGTTGGSEPTWPTTAGQTVNDGTATWTAREAVSKDRYMAMVRAMRPFAIVGVGTDWHDKIIGRGNPDHYSADGNVSLYVEADVPNGYAASISDAALWFYNQVGPIVDEMEAKISDDATIYLDIIGVRLDDIWRTPEKLRHDQGDAYHVLLFVEYMHG
jgi:hypothetical protein